MKLRFVFCALLIAFCSFTLQAQVVAYVANSEDNTVSVIDTTTNTEVAVIPVVNSPYAVAATPDGGTVYVASASSGSISVINTSTNTASTHFIGAVTVFAPAVTPDGQYLWVPTDLGIYIFRTSDLGYVDQISGFAIGLAFDPSTKLAYGAFIGQVYVMNWSTRTVLGALPVQTGNYQIVPAQPIALVARSNFAWVTGGLGNPLTGIYRYSASVVGTIPMGVYTGDVAIAPDGSKVYVTDVFSSAVNILSLSTFAVDPAPLSVVGPAGLALTPDSAWLYVTGGGTVSVFSTATKALTATIPVGNGPVGIALIRLKAPFSNFTSKQLHLTHRKVSVTGSLTLGANGVLDFDTQDVVVQIGDATVVIPAGEVKEAGTGHYIFNGQIDGQNVKFSLDADPGSTTTFTYHVQIQDFTTPLPNPVTVTISIGSNTGTMSVSY
jgi:YVTN family beta-propeller protein